MSERNGREEWLTVAEVARRLGIHERQVRRYANRLPAADRTPAGESPVRVRLSGIVRLKESGQPTQTRFETGQDRPDTSPDTSRRRDNSADGALIEKLQDENRRLWAELEKRNQAESELRRLMLADRSELAELRQQVKLLQAAPSEPPPADTPPDDSTGISEREREAGVYQDGHDGNAPVTGVSDRWRTGRRHAWWQIWKR